jgi:hypothetical protein
VVQVINADTAVIYWFTYDRDGKQRWYFGLADMDGHRMVVRTLYEASGGHFGPDFDPDTVVRMEVGSLVLNFYDDQHGKVGYLLDGDSGYMELTSITQPFTSDDPASAGDWQNGLWSDPNHDGESFVVEVLPGGIVVIFWFTFDAEGHPAWMVG